MLLICLAHGNVRRGSHISYFFLSLYVWFYVLYAFVYFENYVFLLLCLCILIVMYVLFCIFCFHRANWHSSAILTEGFPCVCLSFKANARL